MSAENKTEAKTVDEVDDEEFVQRGAGLSPEALHMTKAEDIRDQDVLFELCLGLQKHGVHMAKRTDAEWKSMEKTKRRQILTMLCSLSCQHIAAVLIDTPRREREEAEVTKAYTTDLAFSLIPSDVKVADGEACVLLVYNNIAAVRKHIKGGSTPDTLPKTKIVAISEMRKWFKVASEWRVVANSLRVLVVVETEVSPIFPWYHQYPVSVFLFTVGSASEKQ